MSTEQTNQSIPNRRQRRYMMKEQGILQQISKLPFLGEVRSKIRRENMEYGKKIHAENVKRNEELNATRLEAALDSLKSDWAEFGYNDKEIAMLEEAWTLRAIKDKETYREDRKRSIQLQREARESRASRNK